MCAARPQQPYSCDFGIDLCSLHSASCREPLRADRIDVRGIVGTLVVLVSSLISSASACYSLAIGGSLNSWKLQFLKEFERTLEAWYSEIGNAILSFRKAIDEPRKMVQRFAEQNA